jgi:glutamine phosphoribosylpyrophosphate amidotransferase
VEGTSIHLRSPRAYLGDRLLGGVLTIDQVSYIPVKSLRDVLEAHTTPLVPQQLTVVCFQGDYYVPVQAVLQYEGEDELRIEAP